MGGKERLDLVGTSGSEAGHGGPPTPTTRHAHGQVGERFDSSRTQRCSRAGPKPAVDIICDQWLGHGQRCKRVQSAGDGGCAFGTTGVSTLEEGSL
jgi:hypothetical protein